MSSMDLPRDTVLVNSKRKHPYKIIEMIGQGGFAITYRAIDMTTSEVVAIKERFPTKGGGRDGTRVKWGIFKQSDRNDAIKDTQLEAESLEKCVHKSIVRYYECFEENDTCYIVMALLVGKSLEQVINEQGGKLSELQVRRYFLQLAEALQEVHKQDLLHRDIKPDNIMITANEDRAVLIDFGIARKFMQSKTVNHTVSLTQGYAPIEQNFKSSKRYASSDIYALSASMYHAVTGIIPLPSMERLNALYKNSVDELVPPNQVEGMTTPISNEFAHGGKQVKW